MAYGFDYVHESLTLAIPPESVLWEDWTPEEWYAAEVARLSADEDWRALRRVAESMARAAWESTGSIDDAMDIIESDSRSDANIEDVAREYLERHYG